MLWALMPAARNLFTELPSIASGASEACDTLLETEGVKIERIVSHCAASPEGFWYDQPQDEWVLVAKGEATLLIFPEERISLKTGDHVLLPAHCRHRVERTSEETVWVAVHVRRRQANGGGRDSASTQRLRGTENTDN
jgi:cupin 2 domain-containing protein